ncbi:MAG TPA: CoA pyrophosphatase [Saprospiraceae bacterium]|nr:CoA pyrophosphatase [Saprospiraceae bacterium]
MAQFGRKFSFNHDDPPKMAGVMILLFPKNEEIHFSLIQRQGHPLDPHQHQISLPGGKQEANENLQQTAVRETFEEIGVRPDLIRVIGELSSVYVGASHFIIHPFVGFLQEYPSFTAQPEEVKELLEIPLAHLLDNHKVKQTSLNVRGHLLKNVPYFDLAEKVVWGATAMVLNEFKEVLIGSDFETS